ncbi:MAG TPA: hypothetical protein ENG83_13015 [Nitrospirae bacterium]|nr:hypothetical protein BMS3Abin06_00710 [bacterium BMS3Abin06]HDH13098.1 hypothetical protein [Nitrospirota bacterium]HDZ02112.1 hypothetical protein [Nitrospirota bacterium]
MGLRIVIAALYVFINISAYTHAAQTITDETVIWVEPGDTYLGLFGNDWMRVYLANNEIGFSGVNGNAASPDKIVVGQKLKIPADTHLTEIARERLSKYEDQRRAAERALQETADLKRKITNNNSETYREAAALLKEAENAADGETYGFRNYIDARRLAEESGRLFAVAQERVQIRRTKQLFAAAVVIIVLCCIRFLRYSRRKMRARYIGSWIKGHQKKIDFLRKPGKSIFMSHEVHGDRLKKQEVNEP